MNKIFIYIFGIGLYLFSAMPFQADARQVYYDDLLQKAVNNSYELKIAGVDINIGKANLKEARSEYFPEIKSAFNLEYNKDLTGGIANVTSVGTTILSSNTRYQSLLYLTLSYNLYDFGIRGRKCFIAGKDIDIKKAVYNQMLRDIKFKMTELYSDALSNYKEMQYKEQLLPLYKELFFMKERLYNAGNVNKLEMMDEAIRLARTIDGLETSKAKLISSLKDISYYTNEEYDIRDLNLEDFETPAEVLPVKEEPKTEAPKETTKIETKTTESTDKKKTEKTEIKSEPKTEAKTEVKTEAKAETAPLNSGGASSSGGIKQDEKAEVKEVQKTEVPTAEITAPVPASKDSKKPEDKKKEIQKKTDNKQTAKKPEEKPKVQKTEPKVKTVKSPEPKKEKSAKSVKPVKPAAKKEKSVAQTNPDYIIQQLELEKNRTKTTFESIPGFKEQFASDEEKFNVQEQRIKDKSAALAPVDLTKTPEFLNYKYQIEQKKAELSILKRQNLPQFAFYSNYAFYGTDKSNPFSSISDIEDRSLAFGITTMLPIFDGFKNKANRERAKLEIMRLEFERDQKLSELKNRYQKLQEASLSYRIDFQNKKDILNKLNKKINAVEKLYEVGLIGKVAFLNEKADLLTQKSELEISLINNISTLKQIETLSEEYK